MTHSPLDSVQHVRLQAAQLVLYQAVLSAPPGRAWLDLLAALSHAPPLEILTAYGQWFHALAARRQTWSDYLIAAVLEADNPFTRQAQRQERSALPAPLLQGARHDLRLLQALHAAGSRQLAAWVQATTDTTDLPTLQADALAIAPSTEPQTPLSVRLRQATDWPQLLDDLIAHYRRAGIGLFARYRAFRWQQGELVGVSHPDPIRLEALAAYDAPRQQLVQNTEALLAGYPALNVLLYGSRGSGKSSAVKALLNEYGDRGLRLIEVAKADLRDLVHIVEPLRDAPQKFIIFVDDLSFEADDEAFKALKVVLEGNIVARPPNVVVYATSNRRHLIREFLGDRPPPRDADEVHAWDTLQEKLSFSDRFGLILTFEPADQATYLAIVHHLATQANLDLAPADLEFRARQWATRHNGRSGRTARQFIDALQAELARQPLNEPEFG